VAQEWSGRPGDLVRVGWDRDTDPGEASAEREWLVANGLGGYASGTIAGLATRRYHGLLVAALANPSARTMMFDAVVEDLLIADEKVIRLSGGSQVTQALAQFRLEMGLPVWTYRQDGWAIEKRLLLAYRQNTVYLRFHLLARPDVTAHESVRIRLRPAMHFRPHNAPLSREMDNYTLCLNASRFEVSSAGQLPSLKIRVEGAGQTFHSFPEREDKADYRWEAARGYEAAGVLWSPGYFEVSLSDASPVFLVASSETWEVMNAVEPQRAWEFERERRRRLLHALPQGKDDALTAELVLATDQFVIAPAGRSADATRARARGEDLRSIIAGYHWFTDWGRDAMISLEGLTLCTGRYHEARYILHSFAQYTRQGLIPNLFPEGSHEGQYNTADASLWFFHALDRYLAYTGDRETLQLLLPTLEAIATAHRQGTIFGIGLDPDDGLLTQGQDSLALTWMDALCDGWVVTPRRGKTVEINALWYNAMSLLGGWVEAEGGQEPASTYRTLAEKTYSSFNRQFWSNDLGYLADYLDQVNAQPEWSLRPNQIFAISLPHPVLEPARWRRVVDRLADSLLTPVGLRSLDPHHADFKPNYHGDLRTRDAAYHQGTVWSWLLGAFVEAWLKVYPEQRTQARALLDGLKDHFGRACIGQVAEIFDATPPFLPRGCIAQAWGVAELMRAWRLTDPARAPSTPARPGS
jgi:predicted glycogen debranching enzyme